MYNAR